MRKMNIQENFTEFYLSEKDNMNPIVIASIINAEYLTRYSDQSDIIKEDVINFVKLFKKDNENIFYSIKDLPIFKFYDTILLEKVEKTRKKINKELTIQENILATQLSNKIFSLQKDFMYSINIDDKTFIDFATTQAQLENELKILLHNQKGVIIFYFSIQNRKYGFGFLVEDKDFKDILPQTLKKYCHEPDVFFTTFKDFIKIKE